jgi:hypothetical protein
VSDNFPEEAIRAVVEAGLVLVARERALADALYDQLDNNVQAAIDPRALEAAKARYREVRR